VTAIAVWLAPQINTAAADAVAGSDSFVLIHDLSGLTTQMHAHDGHDVRVVVVEAEALPELDYDAAELVGGLVATIVHPPRYVIGVRKTGPGRKPSQDAFSAEFSHLCGHHTSVLIEDAIRHRMSEGPPSPPEDRDDKDKAGPGIVQVSQWSEIADYALQLLGGGLVRQHPAVPKEAADLVAAMHRPGTNKRPLSDFHKNVLVGLATYDSAVLADRLSYSQKRVANSYGEIAKTLQPGSQLKPREYCVELTERYRPWFQSFGRRAALRS
jgi:hypothetical protein